MTIDKNTVELYPAQLEAHRQIAAAHASDRPIQFFVGQRSGKNLMINEYINRRGIADKAIVYGDGFKFTDSKVTVMNTVQHKSLLAMLNDPNAKNLIRDKIFIFDEASWDSKVPELLDKLLALKHNKFITISSHGPADYEVPGAVIVKAATWDWAIHISADDVIAIGWGEPDRVIRDYGVMDAHDPATRDRVLAALGRVVS